ncbi:MAG: NAD(P)(+) transhydrogenase (Re/Si-specific) subunit beta [Alphaproteobacteria bacterium]|nr:NAD(P)(+) transhydrogenase (Re/Si-specific) subunit beta [Alphaproteobacteria bacterium]
MATLAAIGLVVAAVIGLGLRDDVPRGAWLGASGVALAGGAALLDPAVEQAGDALLAGALGGLVGLFHGRRDLGERALPWLGAGAGLASVLAGMSRYLHPGVPAGSGEAVSISLGALGAVVVGAWVAGAGVVQAGHRAGWLQAAVEVPRTQVLLGALGVFVLVAAVPTLATPAGLHWLVLASLASASAGVVRSVTLAPDLRPMLDHGLDAGAGAAVAMVGLAVGDDLIVVAGGLLLGVGVALVGRKAEP